MSESLTVGKLKELLSKFDDKMQICLELVYHDRRKSTVYFMRSNRISDISNFTIGEDELGKLCIHQRSEYTHFDSEYHDAFYDDDEYYGTSYVDTYENMLRKYYQECQRYDES